MQREDIVNKRKTHGFTLVEMAASVAVLAIAVLGTVTAVIMASELSRTTAETRQATRTNAALMESIRAAPFEQLVTTFDGTTHAFQDVMPTEQQGTLSVAVTPVDNGSAKWLVYEATITAQWDGVRGDQTMQFVTYIADRAAAAASVSAGLIPVGSEALTGGTQ